jgi:hypothetical protein
MGKRIAIIQGHPDASVRHYGHALADEHANDTRADPLLPERARSECAPSVRAVKEGQFGHSLLKRNEQAWRGHCIEENRLIDWCVSTIDTPSTGT